MILETVLPEETTPPLLPSDEEISLLNYSNRSNNTTNKYRRSNITVMNTGCWVVIIVLLLPATDGAVNDT